MTDSSWKSDAALLVVVLIWGLNFPILKAALEVMHPFVANAFRFTVSVGVLAALFAFERHHQPSSFWRPLRRRGWQIAGLGFLGYVLYQICFIFGLNFTKSGNAALIIASTPLWTALISSFLRYDRLVWRGWTGLLISFVGTIIVVVAGAREIQLQGAGLLLGNLLMLGAAILWGAYTTVSKPVSRDLSPMGVIFFALSMALPLLWGMALPFFETVRWEQVDRWVWAALLFSGGCSTGLAYGLWNRAIQQVGPSHTSVFSNLVPFVALVMSFLLLGERITWAQVAGGVLIIGGIVLMRRTTRRQVTA